MRGHRLLSLVALAAIGAVGACKDSTKVVRVARVEVTGSAGVLMPGETVQLTATVRDDRNNVLTDRSVSWSSSNPAVATVIGGMVLAVSTGSATISAAAEGVSGSLVIAVNNPAPTISTLSPDKAVAGGGAFLLTVTGTGFTAGSVVAWNGQDRATQYVNATTLRASITAADIASAGTINVTVHNPVPGGGSSPAVVLPVNNPAPVITSLSPGDTLYRGAAFTLAITGTGFLPGSVVRWGGQDRTASYVSSTLLRIEVSAADIAAPGLFDVTVVNAAPGGGTAVAARFMVRIPPPGPTIAVRGYHTCAVGGNGQIYCWGRNYSGQLGNGGTTDRALPAAISSNLAFASVVTGFSHACGLTRWGAAYCWGANYSVGAGSTSGNSPTPVPVSGGLAFVQLAAGGNHACGITAAGALYCWGINQSGQIGDGTTSYSRTVPTAVGTGQTWRRVFGGSNHTCAVTTAGPMYCWGANDAGQLGDGTTTARLLPVAVAGGLTFSAASGGAHHTCALAVNGSIYCWGAAELLGNTSGSSSTTPVPTASGERFVALAAAAGHTCAISENATGYCWGSSANGQLGNGQRTASRAPTAVSGPTLRAIAAGELHSCAIATTGAAYCWGDHYYGGLGDDDYGYRSTPTAVQGATSGWTDAGVGRSFSCGLAGTTAYCWGLNDHGQLGTSNTVDLSSPGAVAGGHAFARIAVGWYHACAATAQGAAYCWGWGQRAQLGSVTSGSSTPLAVAGGHLFTQLSAGTYHTCGVTDAGSVYCWGDNTAGGLGDGSTMLRWVPVPVSFPIGASPITRVSAGYMHTCAVSRTGQLYCWGFNGYGQLGDGTSTNRLTPVGVNVAGAAVAWVSTGFYNTCAVTSAGAAYCWGNNNNGALGTGSAVDVATPAPVAGGHVFRRVNPGLETTCGVTTDDRGYCWGLNDYGRAGVGGSHDVASYSPAPVTGGLAFADISTAYYHTCGLTTTGAARCWGRLERGELGIGLSGVALTPVPVQGGISFD